MDARFGFTPDSLEKARGSAENSCASNVRRILGRTLDDDELERLLDGVGEDGNDDDCSIESIDLRPKFVVVEKENLEEFAKAVNEKLGEGYRLHGGMNVVQRGGPIVYINGGMSAVQRDGSIVYIQALAL